MSTTTLFKFTIGLIIGLLSYSSIAAQVNSNFRSPMDIPLDLSGNFGELRPGHFHAGLDIRTQGKVGLNIYAIEDGYVSRIAVSEGGYGKALYITHSNGYTSVYAHLRKFNVKIEKIAKMVQYNLHEFQFDSVLADTSLKVKKGEVIALSGNTGGSAGPHLHFEIRNTATEHPINPLHFGFDVKDNMYPRVYSVGVYPLNEKSSVNGKNQKRIVKTIGGNKYSIDQTNDPIVVNGKIGFAVQTRDKITGSRFNFGVYSIKLFKQNQLVYEHKLDSLDFETTRCMNAHMDYYEAKKNRKKMQRSFLLQGNKLNTYSNVVNKGEFYFLKDDTVQMKYVITDFNGNDSEVNFEVIGSEKSFDILPKTSNQVLKFGEPNSYSDSIIELNLPATCLYENTPLTIKYEPKIGRCVTPIAYINTLNDPLNDYMELKFNLSHIDTSERKNATIVSLKANKQVLAAEGGTLNGDWIGCKTRSFGPYTVFLDSKSPTVSPKNYKPGATYNSAKRLYFYCKDDISGLGEYWAEVDGKWVLVEYEKNRKQLFFDLNDITQNQSIHQLSILILDKVGNKKSYSSSFIY